MKERGINPYALASVVIISVLLFASVEPWAFFVPGSFVLVLFFISAGRRPGIFSIWDIGSSSGWKKLMVFSMAGFFAISLIQVLPLPVPLLKALSPSKHAFFERMGMEGPRAFSLYPYESLNETVRTALYAMLFFMAVQVGGKRRDLMKVLYALAFFGFLLSIFAIIQKAAWNGKLYWFRELAGGSNPFGPFMNRNHFAGFTGMIIPPAMGLALDAKRIERALFFIFLSLVMTLALFYSLSRGGIMSFSASVLVLSFLSAKGKYGGRRLIYIILFLAGLGLFFLNLGISPVIERFARDGVSDSGRFLIWEGSLAAFRDFWPFGTGCGTFRFIFPVYNPGMQAECLYAHNDYLQALVETGVAGGLFLLLFIISLLIFLLRSFSSGVPSYFQAGLAGSLAYISVHSFFDFNLHIPSNAFAFALILGLLTGSAEEGPAK